MNQYYHNESSSYHFERNESAYGVISSRCKRGTFVVMENGETGFCRDAGNVPEGQRVIVTVLRPANEGRRCLLGLDSVCESYEVA